MKKKHEKPYSFRVFVVTDGDSSGLLLEKKKAYESQTEYGYFWLKEPEGLAASDEIRRMCGEECEGLECAKYYTNQPRKYATFRNQERIFRELVAYAKAAADLEDMKAEKPLTQDYSYNPKGYPQILHMFFAANPSKFSDFLISGKVFKRCVLKKHDGKDIVIGMAEEFGIRSRGNVFPEQNFNCLSMMKEVLKTEHPPEAEWFRKTGPVISDFEDKRVYHRKVVDALKKKVLSNFVFLLEGRAATGKTVIVRDLIYGFFKEGESRVYYFDVAERRGFNEGELVNEIRSVKGIFIIENIHLEPRKIQWVYKKIKQDPDRHILFTSRPSYQEFQNKFSEDLNRVDKTTIKPFEDVGGLIDWYCSHPETPSIVSEMRNQIMRVSSKSFWLLAYALRGCSNARGQGEPASWIADEVRSDLRNLENCDERYAEQYPGILLALSPLYRKEVLTQERYLVNELKFRRAALNELVKRGEITRQKDSDDNIFYGLPHSALAEAYWKHGIDYRKRMGFKETDDFIYDYAISGVANGLQAIMEAIAKFPHRLVARLDAYDKLAKLLEKERFLKAIASLVGNVDLDILAKKNVRNAVAHKLDECDDTGWIFLILWAIWARDWDIARNILSLMDQIELVHRLRVEERLFHSVAVIEHVMPEGLGKPTTLGVILLRKLCRAMNPNDVATRLDQQQDLWRIGSFFYAICKADPETGERIWKRLDHENLVTRIAGTKDISCVCRFLCDIYESNIRIQHEPWLVTQLEAVATRLDAARIAGTKDIGLVCRFLCDIYESNIRIHHETWLVTQLKEVAARLNHEKNLAEIGRIFWYVFKRCGQAGEKLWRFLDRENLAAKLSRKGTYEAFDCIRGIYGGNARCGQELCGLLKTNELAKRLNDSMEEYYDLVVRWIELSYKLNKQIGQELWSLLDRDKLAAYLSKNVGAANSYIYDIWSTDKDAAHELCSLLDHEEFASNLKELHDNTIGCNLHLESIGKANKEVQQKLQKLLNIKFQELK